MTTELDSRPYVNDDGITVIDIGGEQHTIHGPDDPCRRKSSLRTCRFRSGSRTPSDDAFPDDPLRGHMSTSTGFWETPNTPCA